MLRAWTADLDVTRLRSMLAEHSRALGFLWSSAGLAVVFGALAQILFARELGSAAYGVLVTANAMANMLGPFAACGIGLMLMQKFGAEGWRAARWVAPGLRVFGVCALLGVAVFAAWAVNAMETAQQKVAALLLAPLVIAFGGVQLAESRFQLEHRYLHVARWQLIKHVSIFTVAALTGLLGWGLSGAATGMFVAAAVTAAAGFWAGAGMARSDFQLQGHGSRDVQDIGPQPRAREVVAEAWPFAATSFGFLLLFQSSVTVVHAFAGAHAAGVYGLAVSVMTAVYLLPRILYRKFFLARVSRWHYQDREKLVRFTTRLVPAVALLAAPIAVLIAVAAPLMIGAVFGAEFSDTAPVLQLLCLAVPFRFLSAGMAIAAVETRHVRERVFWQFGIAGAAVLATIAILPSFSVFGAALVMVIGEVALAGAYCVLAMRGADVATRLPAATHTVVE